VDLQISVSVVEYRLRQRSLFYRLLPKTPQ